MNDEPMHKTGYHRRGAAFEGIAHTELTKLLCSCGGKDPIVAVVHESAGRMLVEVLRQVEWGLSSDEFELSGVPTFGWITLELDEIGARLPLVCRSCRKLSGVEWGRLAVHLSSTPRPRKLHIHHSGVVTL